jgi:hypothetical protein
MTDIRALPTLTLTNTGDCFHGTLTDPDDPHGPPAREAFGSRAWQVMDAIADGLTCALVVIDGDMEQVFDVE